MSNRALSVEVESIGHRYTETDAPVLHEFSLHVPPGGRVCVAGESGAGKTTLLNILGGLLRPGSGRVRIGGEPISALPERARDAFRARHIGFVFQTFQLLPGLSALENLRLSQYFAGQTGRSADERARQLLVDLGLGHKLSARSDRLSVGERQRVAIARAVCKEPGLILADEPTASLDDQSAAAALELLWEQSRSATLIVVSHDARLLERFDQVVRLPRMRVDPRGAQERTAQERTAQEPTAQERTAQEPTAQESAKQESGSRRAAAPKETR